LNSFLEFSNYVKSAANILDIFGSEGDFKEEIQILSMRYLNGV